MDSASIQTTRMLRSLARCNEGFIELSQTLRSSPDVTSVVRGFDCRAYQSGTMIEGYSDAELRSGKGICWWLEVTWNEQHWLIRASVLVNDAQGQKIYKEFADRTPTTLDEFVVQLENATSDLVASYSTIILKDV